MKGKDLLSVADLSSEDIRLLITNAIEMKAKGWNNILSERVLVLLFEKPSLRTRVSFEVAMRQLGGQCLYLSPAEVGLDKRESAPDVARVLSLYANAIAARTFSHETLEILAGNAAVPVINALSDLEHPCQALSDLLTIHEKKGELGGVTLAYIGDGNNVAHSIMLAASLTGVNFRIASPQNYKVKDSILSMAEEFAIGSGASILCTDDPYMAVDGADVVYTDVWASMGQEAEAEQRRKVFAPYQVNDKLVSAARRDAVLMHPLPAHHGEEVAKHILESPQSVVIDQAENRMHLQKALLAGILGGLEIPQTYY